MTVSTTKASDVFPGNGVTTGFPCEWRIFDDTDVLVSLVDQTTGADTPLVLNTDYTISGAGDQSGFMVATLSPVATGTSLYVRRALPYKQPTDFTNQGAFFPTMHEDAMDRLEMQIQQQVDDLVRTLKSNAVTGNFETGGKRVTGAANAVDPGDLTTLAQVDQLIAGAAAGIAPADVALYSSLASTAAGKGSKLVAFIQRITNAVARWVEDKLSEEPSILDFGAVGDGVTDCTTAIQAALNAVGAAGGGILKVPDGTYLVSSRLFFNYSNVLLVGRNRYTNTFKAANNATGIDIHGMFEIASGVNNCGLIEIGVDGNIANNTTLAFGAIFAAGGNSGTVVEKCYFRNCIQDAVIFYSPSSALTHANFRIVDNRLENCGSCGMQVYNGQNGLIKGNFVYKCGSHGIRTTAAADGSQGSGNVRIIANYVNRSAPPTTIKGGTEGGFMIVIGASDTGILIQGNICYDNRNALQDGIGLGQDGVHTNNGCIVDGNIVYYAGLFGIDATNGSTVQNNVILYANQCGIKLGTDLGGVANNIRISNNLIYNANSGTTPGQQGIWVQSAVAGATYKNVSISGNTVVDDRSGASQTTLYGLTVDFTNITFTDCCFDHNDFRRVKTAGVQTVGSLPTSTGWTFRGNRMKGSPVDDFAVLNGATPSVFGYENFQEINGSAVNITGFTGGYNGMRFRVQHNDGNATYKFSGAGLVGNGEVDITPPGNSVWDWWYFNGTWYGQKVN